MRFEELAYRVDGVARVLPFHRKLTVLPGLIPDDRRRWVQRTLGVLHGTAAGSGTTLVFVDGSGSRVRLVRDARGAATVTDLETGEDLSGQVADGGRVDWLALLGLDAASADTLMLLDATALQVGGGDHEPAESAELIEARMVFAGVDAEYQELLVGRRRLAEIHRRLVELDDQIRDFDENLARRRHGRAVRTVQRLEAELAHLSGAEPAERIAAEALLAAARAGQEWERLTERHEEARRRFGDRRRLDPKALARALTLPTEVPPRLHELHAAYREAADRRSALSALLDAGTAAELAAPSAPFVLTLARSAHPDLWERAERVKAARTRAAELSMGLGGTGQYRALVQELEEAHGAVEEAERTIAAARVPALAVTARRRLARAQEAEKGALERAGFVSWLAFQMRRIDVLLEPDAVEALRVAELEAQLAEASWSELAGDTDATAALAARPEIERYASELASAEQHLDSTEAFRRQLADEIDPAYDGARAALLAVCHPFDVEPEHAVSEVSAIVAEAAHARLQAELDAADQARRTAEERLEPLLDAAGFGQPAGVTPAGAAYDLAGRVRQVAARAAETAAHLEVPEAARPIEDVAAELGKARATLGRLSCPDWDEHPLIPDTADDTADELSDSNVLITERSRLAAEAKKTERILPDLDRLTDRREALARRVAVLEASAGHLTRRLSFEEADMVLIAHFAQSRRVGPDAEPLPVVADDPLAAFPRHEKWRLLDLLLRLGEASQVVYLTDDPESIEWGAARAREGSAALLSLAGETVPAY